MRKLFSRRPSPALVVAIIAVILALAGTATAALTKKDKKSVKKIADSEITKLAPGLSVANAANAANASKSANSDALGGVGPGGYTQGGGHQFFGTKNGAAPSTNNALLSIPGIANITFNCGSNGVDNTVTITNTSGANLGDVGQTQETGGGAGASLDPFGPGINNGASVTIDHQAPGGTVADTTLMLWNSQNGKVASIQISNVFCNYSAWASTNQ
jgi:hypothetical protein